MRASDRRQLAKASLHVPMGGVECWWFQPGPQRPELGVI